MASEGIDLEQAWQDACAEFTEATGIPVDPSGSAPTAQEILAKLDKLEEAKDAKSKTAVAKAKKAVGLTLLAVERVGSLVVQGASMAGFGGPANITLNCISFFIDAGFAYQKIADNIGDLFGRIGPIMERSEIYKDNRNVIGPEMTRVAHRLLMAVVKTCEKCITILRPKHSKRAAIGLALKVALFSDDGGVQAQLSILESLQDQESRMAGALTLVTTKNVQRDVATGFQDQKAMMAKIDENTKKDETIAELEKIIGFDRNTTNTLTTEYCNRRNKLAVGTCTWLEDDPEYDAWSDLDKRSNPVMILQGDEGCGKSYTMTAVTRKLMARHQQGKDDAGRVYVAYSYLTRGSLRGDQGSKSEPSVRDALRHWAGQIVTNDSIYRKELSSALKQGGELSTVKELLQKLFLEHSGKDAWFFLLLDGTHELDENGAQELAEVLDGLASLSADSCSVRLLLTTTPKLCSQLTAQAPSTVTTLDLKEKNRADMETYITNGANALAIFKKSTPQIEELKTWVISELSLAVKGDFLVADRTLTEIGNSSEREEVRQIVTRAKEGTVLSNSIEKAIRECNRTLSTKEIQNLNCLLLWVIYGSWTFNLNDLESVLFVQEQRHSLQPLQKEIKEKYSAFFNIDGESEYASVSLKYTTIEDYLKEQSGKRDSPEPDSAEALSDGEIQMARHFIKKLCDENVYNKLGLDDFFEQQAAKSKISVAIDCDNAHAKIVIGCLQALTMKDTEEAEPLRVYARYYLSEHLKSMDLELVDPRLKTDFGPLLMQLFTDPVIMEKSSWEQDAESVDAIVRLLRSSAVVKKIVSPGSEGEKWVKSVVDGKPPEKELLKGYVNVHEKLWFTVESTYDAYKHFDWLRNYYTKVSSTKSESDAKGRADDQEDSVEIIDETFRRVSLPESGPDSVSKAHILRNLGFTYSNCSHVPEAIQQLEESLVLDSKDLLTRQALADVYAIEIKSELIQPDWEKALYHKDLVIAALASGKVLYKDVTAEASWKVNTKEKAIWLRKLGRLEESRELLENLLLKFPDDDEPRVELVNTLYKAGNYSAVVEMFQALEAVVDPDTKKSSISRFLHNNCYDEECHTTIVGAFSRSEKTDELERHYRQATKDISADKGMKYAYGMLSYWFAVMLNRAARDAAKKEEAIRLWELVVDMSKNDDSIGYASYLSARQLVKIYVNKAVEAGKGSPTANSMLDKLRAFSTATDPESNEDANRWFEISPPDIRSLLGRYFTAVGDGQSAKKQLQPDVKVALKLLSDEDPDNDWQGYRKLGDALMDYGDDDNAKAAWSLIQPTQGVPQLSDPNNSAQQTSPVQNGVGEPTSTSDTSNTMDTSGETEADPAPRPGLKRSNTSARPKGPLNYSCDGHCGTEWTYTDDFYVCRECVDVQFNNECLDKLRSGQLSRYICDPAHKFLHVPEWNNASAERAHENKVLVGDRELGVPEWLEGIKQAWGLADSDSKAMPPTVAVAA